MKFFGWVALVMAFTVSTISFAYSTKQISMNYRACMQYLRLPVAKQIQVSRSTGYSLKQINWACNLMKRNGLSKSQRLEKEYQRAVRRSEESSGSGSSNSAPSGPASCSSNIQCGGFEHCVDRVCRDKSQQPCAESGMFQCSTGEKCVSGVCQ